MAQEYLYSRTQAPAQPQDASAEVELCACIGGVGEDGDAGINRRGPMLTCTVCAWLARRPKHHHPEGVADTVDWDLSSSSEDS
jgi:hypothetical protein